MPVPQTSFTALRKFFFLAVFGNFHNKFPGFLVFYYCTQRHINITVLSVAACTSSTSAIATVTCFDMTFKTQMVQRPQTFVSTNNDMTTTTAIATVGTSFFDKFFSVQMRRTFTALTRCYVYFYVIYKIPLGHNLSFLSFGLVYKNKILPYYL